jgi:hypothetical protein
MRNSRIIVSACVNVEELCPLVRLDKLPRSSTRAPTCLALIIYLYMLLELLYFSACFRNVRDLHFESQIDVQIKLKTHDSAQFCVSADWSAYTPQLRIPPHLFTFTGPSLRIFHYFSA